MYNIYIHKYNIKAPDENKFERCVSSPAMNSREKHLELNNSLNTSEISKMIREK